MPSSEKSKLAKLRIPKKGNYNDNDNNDDNTSSLSSKVTFLGSPDLSVGVQNLFKLIKLDEDVRFLIISMNLCYVRNMVQLSDQVFFSRQDLGDPSFQFAIIKILCLEKCFKL
jgi:hypothetical protein